MAIYQYTFSVVPNIQINSEVCISHESNSVRELVPGSVKQNHEESKDDHGWSRLKIKSLPLIIMIDEILDRTELGSESVYCWKSIDNCDHDICLIKDKETQIIKHLEFRVDMRSFEEMAEFLEKIIWMFSNYQIQFQDSDGAVIDPKFESVVAAVLNSRRFQVLSKIGE